MTNLEKLLAEVRELDSRIPSALGTSGIYGEHISHARTLLPKLAEIVSEYMELVEHVKSGSDQSGIRGVCALSLERAEEIAGRE